MSLYVIGALPVHDPTNSFKAYRKAFLDRVEIESSDGFCLGLELTIKAQYSGGKVEEVPAIWRDRSAGESRFRLTKWLPMYLRWYLIAIRRRLFG
jgi:dolichol-phosphate mannosyltransferase